MNYLNLMWKLSRLKQNTKKSRDRVKALQDKKLRQMLHNAYDNSSYYRKTFEAVGITSLTIDSTPLFTFPTINKIQLLTHFDELVTTNDLKQEQLCRFDSETQSDNKLFKNQYHVVHSSGSTGKPRYFVYDEKAWNSMLLGIIRAALWDMSMPQILKLLAKGPRIVYIAATDGRYGGVMAVGDGIDGLHASQLHLDIKNPLDEWIKKLREFKPNIVIGYPSAIKILAGLIENGELSLDVKRVISCGEPLCSGLRHYLEQMFSTNIINFYGASESIALGVETNLEDGMILFDDMNVIENINGEMYLTSLYNFVQPLIRYHISDTLSLKEPDKNSCYPFTKATGLLGRNEDILWFENQDGTREFLHPLAIEGFCIEGLLAYQFRQTGKASFELLMEVSSAVDKNTIQDDMICQINSILSEKGLLYVQFQIIFVNQILPDPKTGKKALIVRDINKMEVVQ